MASRDLITKIIFNAEDNTGKVISGIGIESVTHTLSARGVGFTEARW